MIDTLGTLSLAATRTFNIKPPDLALGETESIRRVRHAAMEAYGCSEIRREPVEKNEEEMKTKAEGDSRQNQERQTIQRKATTARHKAHQPYTQ
jgi:hypothetical protein